jgi:hypothetical protein
MAEELDEQTLTAELMRRGLPMDLAQEVAAIAAGSLEGDTTELEREGGNNA